MSDDKEIKKVTTGKTLGTISFIVSEFIVVLGTFYLIFALFKNGIMDSSIFGNILMFQGSIFVTVWGAKATSNFAKNGKQQ